MKIAIIDVGSNSFHLVIFDVVSPTRYTIIKRSEHLNTMGAMLAADKSIPQQCIRGGVALIQSLCTEAKEHDVRMIKLFSTGIFRHAPNKNEFFTAIQVETGLRVHMLTEEEEAEIIFLAAQRAYSLRAKSLIIDIGGGSTEFISARDNQMDWFASIPHGTAHMVRVLMENTNTAAILAPYSEALEFLKTQSFNNCYGMCGFMRCIAIWQQGEGSIGDEETITPVTVSRADIHTIIRRIDDGEDLGTPTLRAIVRAGSVYLLDIMQEIGLLNIIVSRVSSREGYLLKVIRQ